MPKSKRESDGWRFAKALAELEGRRVVRVPPEPDENKAVLHLMGVNRSARRIAEPAPPTPLHKMGAQRGRKN